MNKIIQVSLDNKKTTIDGSIEDSYTDNIQSHANALLPLLEYAKKLVKPDDVIFDVGANIGLTTIGLARLVPNGKVLAFEPSHKNAERLKSNLLRNGITNTEVILAAVSSQVGGLHFVETAESGSASHVRPSISETNVPTVALDTYRNTENGRGPAFIKIDVEGHEPWVLDSAVQLLNEYHPKIWMEFNSWCLLAFGSLNPLEFAEKLLAYFSISTTNNGTSLDPVSNHVSFTHDNIVLNHCVTDLIMQVREGIEARATFAPTQDQGKPRDHSGVLQSTNALLSQRCAVLEKEVLALKSSTSWRITRPLRALKR